MDKGQSPLRSLMADAAGDEYVAFSSLDEAKAHPDGVVILEGDDGGQIYVVVRAADVGCTEGTLRELLSEIDAHEWPGQPEMAHLCFEKRKIGDGVSGGMGGGAVGEKAWVHPRLEAFRESICSVLEGKSARLIF